MKKIYGWIILIGLVLTVSYFNRWIFIYKFEPEYWENYYYTSQWNVPNSKHIISDEGVYRYIGYRLANGENPFDIDYWVPPMGKYWYGVGAKYLSNPYLISFGFYLLSITVVGLLARMFFKDNKIRWLVVYLWTLNPLTVEQIGQTMLDLPMTLFFLVHVYLLFKFEKTKSIYLLMGAGIFLGLMAGTKPAYFVPMIGLIDWWWIATTSKNNKRDMVWYLVWVIGGYVLAYTCYFIKHPNPIPWIRLHEKVINFQKGNGGSHDVLNIFKTIFLGKYKGFWVGGKEMVVVTWSIIMPLGTILLAKYVLSIKKTYKENKKILYLALIGVGYILMCLTIDFWPRYLVLLVPILIFITGYFFRNKPLILGLVLISYLPWLCFNFVPDKTVVVEKWKETIRMGYYRDAYRLLSKKSLEVMDEKTWLEYGKNNKVDILTKTPVLEDNQWRIEVK